MNKVSFFFLLTLFFACQGSRNLQSDAISEIVGRGGQGFRGISLGDEVAHVRQQEKAKPIHEDYLGLSYAFVSSQNIPYHCEYFSDNLQSGKESGKICAIISHIYLQDEWEMLQYTEQLQKILERRYGQASRENGAYYWRMPEQEVSLRNLNQNHEIVLQWIALKKLG